MMGTTATPQQGRIPAARSFRSVVLELFARFEEAGQPYCIWGGYAELPDRLTGSDIDVLIPDLTPEVVAIFEGLGFVRSRPQVWGGTPAMFILYLPDERAWLPVHVLTSVLPSGYRVAPSDLSGRVQNRGVLTIASPALEAAVLLAHGLAMGKTTGKREKRLAELRDTEGFDHREWREILEEVFGAEGATRLEMVLSGRDSRTLSPQDRIRLSGYLRSHGNGERGVRKLVQKAGRVLRWAGNKVRRAFGGGGIAVVFEGIDGAGKSSAIDFLMTSTGSKRPLFVPGGMAVARFPRLLSRPVRSAKPAAGRLPGVAGVYLPRVLAGVQLVLDWASVWVLYARAAKIRLGGRNVLFDRYAVFHVIKRLDSSRSSPYRRAAEYLFIRLFPKPDYFFYFDIAPDDALQRKAEDPRATLERKHRGYHRLLAEQRLGRTTVLIDACAPLPQTVSVVLEHTWEEALRA